MLVWLWQIAPTEDRGALGSLNQLGINIGILLALVAGLPLADIPSWYSTFKHHCALQCLSLGDT